MRILNILFFCLYIINRSKACHVIIDHIYKSCKIQCKLRKFDDSTLCEKEGYTYKYKNDTYILFKMRPQNY